MNSSMQKLEETLKELKRLEGKKAVLEYKMRNRVTPGILSRVIDSKTLELTEDYCLYQFREEDKSEIGCVPIQENLVYSICEGGFFPPCLEEYEVSISSKQDLIEETPIIRDKRIISKVLKYLEGGL